MVYYKYIIFLDETPPLLSCPQSYVIELVDRQDSYVVNFNETRRRVNVSDASGEVSVTFVPDKATIPIGSFENVTVVAADKYGNKAMCHFQVIYLYMFIKSCNNNIYFMAYILFHYIYKWMAVFIV